MRFREIERVGKMERIKTRVIFWKWPNGSIIGWLLDIPSSSGMVTSYDSIEGHGEGRHDLCARCSTLATPEEYDELKQELERIGYELTIVLRKPRR